MDSSKQSPKPTEARATGVGAPPSCSGSADALQGVLRRLSGVKKGGSGWQTRCPVADHGKGRGDRNQSLSVAEAEDGRVLLHCHAGCALGDILAAVGLTRADLAAAGSSRNCPRPRSNAKAAPPIYASEDAAVVALGRRPELQDGSVTRHVYHHADGTVAFVVLRFDFNDDREKTFRPIRPTAGGWAVGDPRGPLPLYNLPEIGPATQVFVCEGEACAEAARSIGLVTTTSAHGSKSAGKTDWTPLAGKDIVILPDADKPGRNYAGAVGKILMQLNPAARVRIVELPDLPPAGDIVDWIDAHDSRDDDDLRRTVEAIADETSTWQPAGASLSSDTPITLKWQPFPVRVLPEPLRRFIAEGAAAIGCDAAMIALPALAAVAACIGTRRWVVVKKGWAEPAIVWTVIVGHSGSLKSPALDYALRTLRDWQNDQVKVFAERQKVYELEIARQQKALSAWKREKHGGDPPEAPAEPTLERVLVSDATVEALAPILQENPRGLLLVRDELSSWLRSFDAYRSGRGGDVGRWCELQRAGHLLVDRKAANPRVIDVPHAAVSITGGIQPEVLANALGREHFEDGLAPRMLLAMPPRRKKTWTTATVPDKIVYAYRDTIDQLLTLRGDDDGKPIYIGFTPEALERWSRFYGEHAERQYDASGDTAAALSKLEAYCARLALVFHLVKWAARPDFDGRAIDAESIESAVILTDWFRGEMGRVYSWLGQTGDEDPAARKLLEFIASKEGIVSPRDVLTGCRWIKKASDARAQLQRLVDAGHGRWEHPRPSRTGGAPTTLFRLDSRTSVCETGVDGSASGGPADADSADTGQVAEGEMGA